MKNLFNLFVGIALIIVASFLLFITEKNDSLNICLIIFDSILAYFNIMVFIKGNTEKE
jgi:hypothetical protein